MIKSIVQKTTYLVLDTETAMSITLEVSDDKLTLLNEELEDEFIFTTDNTKEVQERWRNVAKLINAAMDMVDRNKKQPKEFV